MEEEATVWVGVCVCHRIKAEKETGNDVWVNVSPGV